MKEKKWLRTAIWLAGMVLLTAGLVYLMAFIENHFKVSIKQYALLAYFIVLGVSFLSSCTILFPAPGMAFTMAAASIWNPVPVAIMTAIGASLGELTAYYAGYLGKKMIIDEQMHAYKWAKSWMDRYGIWAVFIFALVPMFVFDLVGIIAGALRLPIWKFYLACLAGRIPRSFVEAYIGAGVIPLIFPTWFL
ncbi:MAG: VTT domain-containing protein [Dehalococcoidia bacterium]|jgi:membrane protein YqaA with SNARE-associated domain